MAAETILPQGTGPKARIQQAAQRRFERFGFRRTGVTEIARDAGVAAGTLYRYFRNKEDIFLRVLDAENDRWLECAKQALDVPGGALTRLMRLGAASVAFNAESALFRAVIDGDADMVAPPLREPTARKVREGTVSMMADVLRAGIDEGSLRPIDPDATALVLYVAGQALFNEPGRGYQALATTWMDLVSNGISAVVLAPDA